MKNDVFEVNDYLSVKKLNENNLNYIEQLDKIKKHNKEYINNQLSIDKKYFDDMFKQIDSNIKLDEEQRKAILKNEDYNLIIAGAGSGKTTTMMAKIKYLIDKKNVQPDEILAISFAKKNTEELKEKLKKQFNLDINVTTFHKLGLNIIEQNTNKRYSIIEDNVKNRYILNYFKNYIYKNKYHLNNVLNFLTLYLDEDEQIKNFKSHEEYCRYLKNKLFDTIKGDLAKYNRTTINKRKSNRKTINNEKLRSKEEVMIANFLFLNGINYEYEKRYEYKLPDNKIYCPDFTIKQGENIVYLEHFGINENGTSDLYNDNGINKYINEINRKIETHKMNNTKLIYTFSKFNDGKPLLEHLKELLIENNFILKQVDEYKIFNRLFDSMENPRIAKFCNLISEFISNMKLNEYTKDDIRYLINNVTNYRTKLFIKCVEPFYLSYQKYLNLRNKIDFDDMIIKAIKIVETKEIKFPYKYIIVDEYQDISFERFELIKKLSDKYNSNITVVGDDWQAIFSFAGSNVSLFTDFKEILGYRSLTKIINTYRNSQELIDVASEFVSRDKNNIKKTLNSNKHINKPVCVLNYKDGVGKVIEEKAISITKAIGKILQEKNNAKIMLLGRYNNDMEQLLKTHYFYQTKEKIINSEYKQADIEFYTVHKSKGLEADYVIIINAIDSTYGFPSKVKSDELFKFFNYRKENVEFAEERRLFYVALTRTKNKVYIITSDKKPSPFVKELEENINVEFIDKLSVDDFSNYKCPQCGGYLKYQYYEDIKDNVFRCCTDKEVCDFMTNNLIYKPKIEKCPKCDGYLVFKQIYDNNKLYMGCTNYKLDGTGCNYTKIKSISSSNSN